MPYGISPPDPYVMQSGFAGANVDVNGLTVRSAVINGSLKTLVLLALGQSQLGNVMPTAYVPTNSGVVDNLNPFDGALYSITGRLVGCTNSVPPTGGGFGNIATKVADLMVTNGKFDRVIIANVAIGGTFAAQWGTGNLSDRTAVAMRRLAARGITPSTTGVTFAALIGVGESDGAAGTSAASYSASINSIISATNAAGFSGRYFLTRETWLSGVTYSTIQNAQSALWNGTTIFSGGNWDSLDATNRQAGDNTHFTDTGGAAAALLTYNAMHASGAPF